MKTNSSPIRFVILVFVLSYVALAQATVYVTADDGEGTNLWRQFIHIAPDGSPELFYNSGYYGHEQLYMKHGKF